jgi:hypothetical protein
MYIPRSLSLTMSSLALAAGAGSVFAVGAAAQASAVTTIPQERNLKTTDHGPGHKPDPEAQGYRDGFRSGLTSARECRSTKTYQYRGGGSAYNRGFAAGYKAGYDSGFNHFC